MMFDVADPTWWRGQRPPAGPRGKPAPAALRTGDLSSVPPGPDDPRTGLSSLYFFEALVNGAEVVLTDVALAVEWSQFLGCHFRQRVKPVTTGAGFAAQGSFGNSPALYRGCTFERIRFKTLGGFTLGQARFEDCTFLNCRWEGHLSRHADLVGNRFMNGCVWFGNDRLGDGVGPTEIHGNDFSQTTFTPNVGWRGVFPLEAQRWPEDSVPVADG